MRIDQSIYQNPIQFNTQPDQVQKKSRPQTAPPIKGPDSVNISKEARSAYESYALNARKQNEAPDAKEDFRAYLKRCREEPKTPEDRLKELQEKLKEIQEKISETADRAGIANPSRQEIQEAGQQADQGASKQDALGVPSKVISPSSRASLEALFVQMDQIVEEIKKVSEEL